MSSCYIQTVAPHQRYASGHAMVPCWNTNPWVLFSSEILIHMIWDGMHVYMCMPPQTMWIYMYIQFYNTAILKCWVVRSLMPACLIALLPSLITTAASWVLCRSASGQAPDHSTHTCVTTWGHVGWQPQRAWGWAAGRWASFWEHHSWSSTPLLDLLSLRFTLRCEHKWASYFLRLSHHSRCQSHKVNDVL